MRLCSYFKRECTFLKNESKNMNTEMQALKAVQNIQGEDSNPNKTKVRAMIRQQIESFAKQQGFLSLLSLPATDWLIERELLKNSKNDNIPCSIIGLENNPKLFPLVEANKPKGKNVEVYKESFERFGEWGQCGLNLNAFWADYCACFKVGLSNGFDKKYPLIQSFVSEITSRKYPFLYYMTFSLNGRIIGGRMDKYGNKKDALQFAQELKNIIFFACRNLPVIPILSVIYKGAMGKDGRGQQTMITIGFAVNMGKAKNGEFWSYLNDLPSSFPFKPFKAKFLKNKSLNVKKEMKETIKVSTVTTDMVSLRKQAVRILYDKGMPNPDIATVLNLTRNQVGSVLAHHCHPESFRK